jgi:hypothetical protein
MTTLLSLDSTTGEQPLAGLFQSTTGTFYGATFENGWLQENTVQCRCWIRSLYADDSHVR